MGGPATQQQEGQRQGRTDAANQQIVIPEALQVDVRQYRASRQRRLVCRQVGHPERVHNAGNNQRAVDTGEPENLAHQNREQNRRQRVGGGNQRLQQMHDRLRQDHPGLRFDKQIQRMQSRNNHQHRDQDFKRTGDAGGDLFRQTNRNVVLLQPRVNAGGVDGGDQRGENALTGQILSGNFAIGIGCGDQQESHKRQQTGHHRIELKLTTEAGANADRDKEGHHAHAEVKRQHQLFAVVLGEIKPAAGKAVGGIG
ncbi:Uncharacterised protein [Klebsiella pneumoniae]|nr:Uncharacterised protein [Klebsiella pneumoniae]SBI09421.1 Uncharacterised protein [Klebsiella pneumoniae]SCA33578.1 Uncharacterised protein [Klebsiella pneumoniae]SVT44367.1 Uncharacterised protein [Klebsiella pneumoniae]SWA52686.1 Uncharacterised protein [Klebsiella pneumoniae]